MASETYWAIRRSSQNVRAYLSLHYPGDKKSKLFRDLWVAAECIDTELDIAHRHHGLAGVQWALATSDTLEHLLARIGAEVALLRHKDPAMYEFLQTSKPPGESDVLPEWALAAARDSAKATHQTEARVEGRRKPRSGKACSSSSDEAQPRGGARRRTRAKAKATASPPAEPRPQRPVNPRARGKAAAGRGGDRPPAPAEK